jgi:hypothetical protein
MPVDFGGKAILRKLGVRGRVGMVVDSGEL